MAFVAKQVGVPPGELGFYEWWGSTIGYHRSQIRAYLGFRECSVQDADTLTGWLAVHVGVLVTVLSPAAMECRPC